MILRAEHVVRTFQGAGVADFEDFLTSDLYGDFVARGWLVPFDVSHRSENEIKGTSPRLWSVSYPYEWSFSMLRDAALLTIDLAEASLRAGYELRDASAFNIVFESGKPRWVDLGSFRRRRAGIWEAYGQFLDHFLNPLAAGAYSGMGVRPEWVGSLEGLGARSTRRRVSLPFLIRNGLMRDVGLRARLQARAEQRPTAKPASPGVELPTAALIKNLSRIRRVVRRLEPGYQSHWESYDSENTYETSTARAKAEAVEHLASFATRRHLAFDVGTNVGTYALLLARHFERVVAMDADEAAIDSLYRHLSSSGSPENVLAVVGDMLDPSPPRGLQLAERAPLLGRYGTPDLTSWLAVVHHLVLGRNVPLPLFFDLARSISETHLLEVPTEDDPMVDLLLARRSEPPWPYSIPDFEQSAAGEFNIVEKVVVSDTRIAYLLRAR